MDMYNISTVLRAHFASSTRGLSRPLNVSSRGCDQHNPGSTRCSGAKYARLITGGTGAVCIAAYDGLLPLGARSWNYSYSDWGTQTEAYARLSTTELSG